MTPSLTTYRWRDLILPVEGQEPDLRHLVASELALPPAAVRAARIVRKSLDARRKPYLRWVVTVEFELREGVSLPDGTRDRLEVVVVPPPPTLRKLSRPAGVLVVGRGPAGLFAALRLAEHGAAVTLCDQGEAVEQRVHTVNRFWQSGTLNPCSNVQFGEGGAGTFSDGKLTTRLNHPWLRGILETLVARGAPSDILI